MSARAKVEPEAAVAVVQPAAPVPLERTGPHVFAAICDITAAMAKDGIAKTHKNKQGEGYMFRGIDDVYDALAAKLGKHRLVIIPRVLERSQVERATRNGGNLFYTVLDIEYDLVSALDGSKQVARVQGEAMDSGDKSTSKAMSAAYKAMAFQVFCIPIDGKDSEEETHELAAPLSLFEKAMNHLRTCSIDKGSLVTAWEFGKAGWKNTLDADEFGLVVAEKDRLKALFVDEDEDKADFVPAPPRPDVPRRAAPPAQMDSILTDDDLPEAFK